jgi:uncharacterized membrane protein YhaH (DUF805 family)
MRSTYHYRSFFWPAVLILVGVIALLANTGQIPADRLYNLVVLWPLILVVVGLELIVRRTLRGVTGDVVAAVIIVLAIIGATAYVAAAPSPTASHALDSKAELGSITSASLEIDAGAAEITVSGTTDVGSNLYVAHIDYSGPAPEVVLDRETGALRIDQPGQGFLDFGGRRFTLDLKVNPSIPWKITQNTGAATDTYNLASVHVTGMQTSTGASRDDITLGSPSGIVNIAVNGGSLMVHFHRPQGVGTLVDISGGAVSLDFDGQSYHAVGHISVGSSLGSDGYKVDVNGGACSITVDSAGGLD